MTLPSRPGGAHDALPRGIELHAPLTREHARILTFEALDFVARLERAFRTRRAELLELRKERQARFDAGEKPDFLESTADIRAADWRIAPTPADLRDRRVEITGPVQRKMIVNAMNSGACVFMADFEDSLVPTWDAILSGQVHLASAVRRTLDFVDVDSGKRYTLHRNTATLIVRPRGWHLEERHVTVDGAPVSASIFDFALYLFHNAARLVARGSGPYYYLPKLESHLEARLWNDIFLDAQLSLGLELGTIKATVLIETLPAAFEMDEILHELREHVVGLNCGRWDYIFSFIKTFREHPGYVLPDRSSVGMERHFLSSYSRLLIRTCHRRGAHAMGGMAAQIPVKNDPATHAAAIAKVRADKRREARDGHDGTWVAHPALVEVARGEFDEWMEGDHQLDVAADGPEITATDLLTVPRGPFTLVGLQRNLSVGVRYLAAWLSGRGCVPLDHLMEDTATAEICRAQVWQWVRHGVTLGDGRRVDANLVRNELAHVLAELRSLIGDVAYVGGRHPAAAELMERLITAPQLADFLTLEALAEAGTA